MPPRKFFIVPALLILGVLFYFLFQSPREPKGNTSAPSVENKQPPFPPSQNQSPPLPSRAETLRSRTISPKPNLETRVTRYTDGSVDFNPAIKASSELHQGKNPQLDLEIISQIFSHYRFLYKNNPVGVENFEFTAALTGDNPKQVNLIDPNNSALNSNNELVDRWGSPFVFHPLSATEMEIRSLGPDKTLWTQDDLSLDYKAAKKSLQLNAP